MDQLESDYKAESISRAEYLARTMRCSISKSLKNQTSKVLASAMNSPPAREALRRGELDTDTAELKLV